MGTAFLNAEMSGETVHVILDKIMTGLLLKIKPEYEKYVTANGEIIMELDKALYGCIQSARLWYDKLRSVLEKNGFKANDIDQCVFNKTVEGKQVTLIVYVDDILCLCADQAQHDALANLLSEEFSETKYEKGDVLSFLGMTLDFRVANQVKVTMAGYEASMLSDFITTGVANSPAGNNLFNIDSKSPRLNEEERSRFHTYSAKLLYLGCRTRPEIQVATSFLSSRVTVATEQDAKKLDRVMKYLNNTRGAGLVLEGAGNLVVRAYIDASHGILEGGEGHHGLFITLGLGDDQI